MRELHYTIKSFLHLTEQEARKSKDPTRRVVSVEKSIKKLKLLREQYYLARRQHVGDNEKLVQLRQEYLLARTKLRAHRDELIKEALVSSVDKLEKELEHGKFTWKLSDGPEIGTRKTYRVDPSLHRYLAGKQAEAVIRHAATVSPLSRNSIIRSLKNTLEKTYRHSVIRLDIKHYFDSISHATLLDILDENRQVDSITKHLVSVLLKEFGKLTRKNDGIPQGVGISSQLAEIYLSNFDKIIRSQPGVLYYARYVDDIVLVVETAELADSVQKEINIQLNKLGLVRNHTKDCQIDTTDSGEYPLGTKVEYLGYVFNRPVGSKDLFTSIVDRRVIKKTSRMDRAFEVWNRKSPDPTKPNTGNDGLLVDRVRYLAGNIKLSNTKSNVVAGIYYSNSSLDEDSVQLTELDDHLQKLIKKHEALMSTTLTDKLKKISFRVGFQDRAFLRFSPHQLERISICWRELPQ